MAANPACGQLRKENGSPCSRSRLRIWSRETGSAGCAVLVQRYPPRLFSTPRLNLALPHTSLSSLSHFPPYDGAYPYVDRHAPSAHNPEFIYQVAKMRPDGVHSRGPEDLRVARVPGAVYCIRVTPRAN